MSLPWCKDAAEGIFRQRQDLHVIYISPRYWVDTSLARTYNRLYNNAICSGGVFMEEIRLDDLVQMRKTHPCGSDRWTVIRIGADIKIKCCACGRLVMLDRQDFMRAAKKILVRKEEENS